MEVFNLDPIQAAIMLGMVAGVVELIKRLFKKDWKAAATIVCAGAVGALTALALAISPLIGAVVGLAASGYITIVQKFGENY